MLHPPDGFLVEDAAKLVVAFYVSSFCVARLGHELKGVRLEVNGAVIIEQDLLVHSNDGSAQYHVALPGLRAGVYHVNASLSLTPAGLVAQHKYHEGKTAVEDDRKSSAVAVIEVLAPLSEEPRQDLGDTSKVGLGEGENPHGLLSWAAKLRCQQAPCAEKGAGISRGQCGPRQVWWEANGAGEEGGSVDQGGTCLCDGDWVGAECDTNLFFNHTYLPPLPFLAQEGGGKGSADAPQKCVNRVTDAVVEWRACVSAQRWLHESMRVTGQVLGLHRSERCTPQHTLYVSLLGKAMGAQIHFVALALSAAIAKGRGLIFDEDDWVYAKHDACPTKDRSCYLTSLWAVEEGDRRCHRELQHADPVRGWELEMAATHEGNVAVVDTARHLRQGMVVPGEFRSMGLFWWRSTLLALIARPSRYLEALVREAKGALRWPAHGRVIGLHVRRGDSCLHAAMSASRPLCLPAAVYFGQVEAMAAKYGAVAVMLATDSDDVVHEARQRFHRKEGGLRVMAMGFDRSLFQSNLFIEHMSEARLVDVQAVAETTLVDLMLLSSSDVLVGGFASQLSRLALSLMASRQGRVPPFISVDGYPWGRHAQEEMWEVAQELGAVKQDL